MSKYRIIEKNGEYARLVNTQDPNNFIELYTPRYIVQQIGKTQTHKLSSGWKAVVIESTESKDLKEFNDLIEARKYKRDLELDDGIVIE